MKSLLLSLSIIILLSCSSQNKDDTLSADSTATVVSVTPAAEALETTNSSTPVNGLSGTDTVFNFLARKKIVRGEFGDVRNSNQITSRVRYRAWSSFCR